MTTKFDELAADLHDRQRRLRGDRNIHTVFMRELDPSELIAMSVTQVLKGAEAGMTLVDVAVSLGNRIRQKHSQKRDSVAAAHCGWFVMISYLELGLIGYYLKHTRKKGKRNKHRSYHLSLKNWPDFAELWEKSEGPDFDMFPRTAPMDDWDSGLHTLGYPAVRKADVELLNAINTEEDEVFLNTLNRLGRAGWRINNPVLDVFQELKDDPTGPFRVHREKDPAKITSLKIETDTIYSLAKKFRHQTHYHLWSADFRGRVYALTAFLHPQGSDSAKGLLLFDEDSELGPDGKFWLYVHTANVWGWDKLSLEDRYRMVADNLELMLRVAEDPLKNREWFAAEKPWSFLAACFELAALKKWETDQGTVENYRSRLPVYVDGKCNGLWAVEKLGEFGEHLPQETIPSQAELSEGVETIT